MDNQRFCLSQSAIVNCINFEVAVYNIYYIKPLLQLQFSFFVTCVIDRKNQQPLTAIVMIHILHVLMFIKCLYPVIYILIFDMYYVTYSTEYQQLQNCKFLRLQLIRMLPPDGDHFLTLIIDKCDSCYIYANDIECDDQSHFSSN